MYFLLLFSCLDYDIKEHNEPILDEDSPPETEVETDVPDCSVSEATIEEIEIDEECVTPEYNIQNPWNVEIEWQWRKLAQEPGYSQVVVAPIVGNLTDDDGDGQITETDTPDIVFVVFDQTSVTSDYSADARLVAMDGHSGAIHWMQPGFSWMGGPAIADINNDGYAEVIAINQQKYPVAVSGRTGETIWESSAYVDNVYAQVAVADLNGDGTAEVIVDNAVLNGANGQLLWYAEVVPPYRIPAIGDLDQDGSQEVIIANNVYNSDGTLRWSSSIEGEYGHWAAILNADEDLQGEVAMVGSGMLGIYEHDGTPIFLTEAGTPQPGPPCVADFDGDDVAEIAWASSSMFNMYELDGDRLWSQAVTDASGLAGCSGYDINGDGAYEVLFADENTFWVFDGTTGSVLFSQAGHASGTLFEYPIVADVDADNSAEIIVASNNYWTGGEGWTGITVFGHQGNGWAASGPTWNVHDFAVTNIYPDGGVPMSPEPSWQVYNVYRARPTQDALTVDLFAEITDICFAGCEQDSIVRLTIQPSNQGPSSIRANIPVSLYRKDGNSYTFLVSAETQERIEAGYKGASLEFETTYGRIEGAEALVARADDWGNGFGSIIECDEWNNGIEFTEITCVAEEQ